MRAPAQNPTRALANDLSWSEGPDGERTILFEAGAILPAQRTFVLPPAPNRQAVEIWIGTSEARRQARISVRGPKTAGETSAEISVRLDASGCYWADGRQGSAPLTVLCETLEAAVVVEDKLTLTIPILDQRTLGAFIGYVRDGWFHVLFTPQTELPSTVEHILDLSDGAPRFVDLLVISPDDLYEDEIGQLAEDGALETIDDDDDELIEFSFEEAWLGEKPPSYSTLRVTVDAERKLHVDLLAPDRASVDLKLWSDASALHVGSTVKRQLRASAIRRDQKRPSALLDRLYPERRVGLERPDFAEIVGLNAPQMRAERAGQEERDRAAGGDAPSGADEDARVFVSYRTGADSEAAHEIVGALEATGMRCWIAPRDIGSGDNWNRAIAAAIETASHLLVIVSPRSLESEFVQAEVQLALNWKKQVVPVLIEPVLSMAYLDARLEVRQRVEWTLDKSRALVGLLAALRRS